VLSYKADTSILLSSENATIVTYLLYLSNYTPVAISQSQTVLSYKADTSVLLSGENATIWTGL
ncbi:hypothetical protein C8A01DRAFT_20850, partial [Parachaetomium inaequale]